MENAADMASQYVPQPRRAVAVGGGSWRRGASCGCEWPGEGEPSATAVARCDCGAVAKHVLRARAQRLMRTRIEYIPSPEFEPPDAAERIGAEPRPEADDATVREIPVEARRGVAPYLTALCAESPLRPQEERDLFRRYNYLKHQAARLREQLVPDRPVAKLVDRVDALLLSAEKIRSKIIRANLRLVVALAKRYSGGPLTMSELISVGNMALMCAVEKFDYTRGFRLATYASWAVLRKLARAVPKEQVQLGRFVTGQDELLGAAGRVSGGQADARERTELREALCSAMGRLSPQERSVLRWRYGLVDHGQTKTLVELGEEMHCSRECIRQIELRALSRLRGLLDPADMGMGA